MAVAEHDPQSSTIHSLSSGIWSVLLGFLPPLEIFRVWMVGDTIIQRRLGMQGGWKALELGKAKVGSAILKWPRLLLSQLHGLSHLCFRIYHSQCHLSKLRPTMDDLQQLPKSLTSLELRFIDDLRDEHIPFLPPQLTRLSLPLNRSISHEGLDLLPHSIAHLNLKSNFRISDFWRLPRNLITYFGNANALKPSRDLPQSLPPHLNRIQLWSNEKKLSDWKPSDLSLFSQCSELTSIEIMSMAYEPLHPDIWTLPANLESLELYRAPWILESWLSALPPTLKKLIWSAEVIVNWSPNAIKALPRSLEQLEIYCNEPTLTPVCLQYLPPQLKILSLTELALPPGHDTQDLDELAEDSKDGLDLLQRHLDPYCKALPPTLTTLSLFLTYKSWKVAPSAASIPDSLVNFSGAVICLSDEHISQDITMRSGVNPILESHGVDNMETTLESHRWRPIGSKRCCIPLGLHSLTNGPPLAGYTQIKSMHPETSFELISLHAGPTIQRLVLENVKPSELVYFPPTLEFLSLRSSKPLLDAHIATIPDSVVQLKLYQQKKSVTQSLTDACILVLPLALEELFIHFPTKIRGDMYPWPSKLIRLMLCSRTSSYIPPATPFIPYGALHLELHQYNLGNDLFQRFTPPFLSSLTIRGNNRMTGAFFSFLPDTLLKITIENVNMQDSDILALPRGLKEFISFSGEFLTDDSAVSWPPLISNLAQDGRLYTNRAIITLPRSLRILVLPNGTLIDPEICRQSLNPMCSWSIGQFASD